MEIKKQQTNKTMQINAVNQWGRNILPIEWLRTPSYITFMSPYLSYENAQHLKDVDEMWTPELKAMCGPSTPHSFRLICPAASGSSANNLLLNLAKERVAQRRKTDDDDDENDDNGRPLQRKTNNNNNKKGRQDARILVLRHSYVASKGRLANISSVNLSSGMLRYDLSERKQDDDANICEAPWSFEYMETLRVGDQRETLDIAEIKSLNEIEAKIIAAELTTAPVGLILLELLNVTTFEGLSGCYVRALRLLTQRYGVALAIDEIMTGLKTWTPFLFMQFRDLLPDYVTFGKAFVLAGVLAVNKTDEEVKKLRYYVGETTCAVDASVIAKSRWVMRCFQEHKLFKHILELDDALLEHFAQTKSHDKHKFVCNGVGLMWKSSHMFSNTLMAFSRLLLNASFPLANVKLLLPTFKISDSTDDLATLTKMFSDCNGFVCL